MVVSEELVFTSDLMIDCCALFWTMLLLVWQYQTQISQVYKISKSNSKNKFELKRFHFLIFISNVLSALTKNSLNSWYYCNNNLSNTSSPLYRLIPCYPVVLLISWFTLNPQKDLVPVTWIINFGTKNWQNIYWMSFLHGRFHGNVLQYFNDNNNNNNINNNNNNKYNTEF